MPWQTLNDCLRAGTSAKDGIRPGVHLPSYTHPSLSPSMCVPIGASFFVMRACRLCSMVLTVISRWRCIEAGQRGGRHGQARSARVQATWPCRVHQSGRALRRSWAVGKQRCLQPGRLCACLPRPTIDAWRAAALEGCCSCARTYGAAGIRARQHTYVAGWDSRAAKRTRAELAYASDVPPRKK